MDVCIVKLCCREMDTMCSRRHGHVLILVTWRDKDTESNFGVSVSVLPSTEVSQSILGLYLQCLLLVLCFLL